MSSIQPIQPIQLDAELLTNTLRRYHQDLRRLRRTLIAVLTRLDAAQILADELAINLSSLAKLIGGAEGGTAGTSIALGRGAAQGGLEPAPVARSLELKRRTDGFVEVRIDCSEDTLRLPPLLGSLLKFLAEGENPDPQEAVVGWRMRDEILAHLKSLKKKPDNSLGEESTTQDGKEEEPTICASYVAKLIYLLRAKLGEQHGRLVESNRQKGWRFSLRRGDAGNLVRTRLAGDGRPSTGKRVKSQGVAPLAEAGD